MRRNDRYRGEVERLRERIACLERRLKRSRSPRRAEGEGGDLSVVVERPGEMGCGSLQSLDYHARELEHKAKLARLERALAAERSHSSSLKKQLEEARGEAEKLAEQVRKSHRIIESRSREKEVTLKAPSEVEVQAHPINKDDIVIDRFGRPISVAAATQRGQNKNQHPRINRQDADIQVLKEILRSHHNEIRQLRSELRRYQSSQHLVEEPHASPHLSKLPHLRERLGRYLGPYEGREEYYERHVQLAREMAGDYFSLPPIRQNQYPGRGHIL
ncbi:hypothetical protein FOZ62_017079 [Perkinsus olseni]|uniref:Uncharacterized protein n=1 Tax=Perkinsus olseni TaxID=32597 RepID=A0A7J6TZV5_PEROL|nr:hypothetical protein FOZ62_017079 [Perkinsus olseni]